MSTGLLAACVAAPPAAAPSPAASAEAPAVAPSPSPSAPGVFKASPGALDQQDKAIHGSTLNAPTLTCTPPPATSDSVKLTVMCDAGLVDRMGIYNYVAADANGATNANYGKDRHLAMQLNRFVDAATISKITLEVPGTGYFWTTVGKPESYFLGVALSAA